MKRYALILILIAIGTAGLYARGSHEEIIFIDGFESGDSSAWNTHTIIGICTFIDDVARFDAVLGTFFRLNLRPAGTNDSIAFVDTGAPGVTLNCPPNPPVQVVLTFRIEPDVIGLLNDVPVHALEVLGLVPLN